MISSLSLRLTPAPLLHTGTPNLTLQVLGWSWWSSLATQTRL